MKSPFSPRSHYRHWQPIVTRWSDNDMYDHVNNAVYYHWFDTAVNNWLFAAGLLDVAAGETIGRKGPEGSALDLRHPVAISASCRICRVA